MSQHVFIAHREHREGMLALEILNQLGHGSPVPMETYDLSEDVAASATVFVPIPEGSTIPSRYLRVFPADLQRRLSDLNKRGVIVPVSYIRAQRLVGIQFLDGNYARFKKSIEHMIGYIDPSKATAQKKAKGDWKRNRSTLRDRRSWDFVEA